MWQSDTITRIVGFFALTAMFLLIGINLLT